MTQPAGLSHAVLFMLQRQDCKQCASILQYGQDKELLLMMPDQSPLLIGLVQPKSTGAGLIWLEAVLGAFDGTVDDFPLCAAQCECEVRT